MSRSGRNRISIPGIGGSGPAHWQSIWEADDDRIVRFSPSSWALPELDDWIAALDRAVAACPVPPLLIAHSLGCLLVAHWAFQSSLRAAGALLVAVPDPGSPSFPSEAGSFQGAPDARLPFPTLILASDDDPYCGYAHARRQADGWGATALSVGAIGHVNAASGIGAWRQGHDLLSAFSVGLD